MSRPQSALRAVAYGVLPAELMLIACLLGGVTFPQPVLAAAEAALVLLLAAEVFAYLRLRSGGRTRQEAVAELAPAPVLRLVGHELRLMRSLFLWVGRRRDGVGPGDRSFGHARDQAALMYGFTFVCVVETVAVSYLLMDRPAVHAVLLVVDLYTVLFMLGLQAASVTRPHVLSSDTLRLRQAGHVDLRIPLDRIADVRYELLFTHEQQDGVLDLKVAAQTSVTLELSEPVTHVGLLGRERPVRTVRAHADDARAFAKALREAADGRRPAQVPVRPA
ncbi:hypothetical protein [Streptomyces xantholiticus]|uniref:hypothetical protein n=1 Tax=Streptomyces xantholiticus TaxID=68285 RepID=UPI00167646EF|nr:hypothetical protein [Streptomyces xantholiticus]GGW30637.1 hypothetical protein GCM10010381_13890 [Streptomyces xantholiticus]